MSPISSLTTPRRYLLALLLSFFAHSVQAEGEMLVYAFSDGEPVAGATVEIDGEVVGTTGADGSVLLDLVGAGQKSLTVVGDAGEIAGRFSSAQGQLVDVVADIAGQKLFVDVYSQSENVSERSGAAEGTVTLTVKQGSEPASRESVYIAGSDLALETDDVGVVSVTLPRGRYRTQVAEQIVNLRVVGGLTRAVVVTIDEQGETVEIASPSLEEVFVVASFDPSGLEVSERDASNIVDTIGVELLTRFADSDVAASVVRVPGISVQDDKYVFIRGLGGRYVSSTLNNATMPSTNPSKRTVPLDLFEGLVNRWQFGDQHQNVPG